MLISYQNYILILFIFNKNEKQVIYDLLEKSSGHLELREDPEQGIIVAGLRCIKVKYLFLGLLYFPNLYKLKYIN